MIDMEVIALAAKQLIKQRLRLPTGFHCLSYPAFAALAIHVPNYYNHVDLHNHSVRFDNCFCLLGCCFHETKMSISLYCGELTDFNDCQSYITYAYYDHYYPTLAIKRIHKLLKVWQKLGDLKGLKKSLTLYEGLEIVKSNKKSLRC